MIAELFILAVFPGLVAYAAATDLLTMTIPNRIPLGLVAAFVLAALWAGLPAPAWALHASAGLAMLVLCFALFSFGYVGGGDAKLFAAVALWFGWHDLVPFAIYTALVGGALALILVSMRRMPLPAGLARLPWLLRLHDPEEGAPYGVAIAAGALIVYSGSSWLALAG